MLNKGSGTVGGHLPQKFICVVIIFSLIFTPVIYSEEDMNVLFDEFDCIKSTSNEMVLPPLSPIDMVLEETMFRRCSIREFSDEMVTIEDLSTILWAAYGYRDDGKRTVPPVDETYGVKIYVLLKNESLKLDVYTYDALNHSLLFLKKISSMNFAQYKAPAYIGLVWNKNKSDNENYICGEIGGIGQNIAFAANALNLGSVVNADILPWAYLANIGLPDNEIPKILMPLGHPRFSYNFEYRPWDFSLLPKIKRSDMSLTESISQRMSSLSWSGSLTKQEQYQMIWSTYGFSYLLDTAESDFYYHIDRHRTVPSAHGYYPLRMYYVTEKGIYQYHPNVLLYLTSTPFIDFAGLPILSYIEKMDNGDQRDDLASACLKPALSKAPLVIIPVLDLDRTRPEGGDDFSGEEMRWMWYYEAAASAYNVQLVSTAWDLSSNMFPIEQKNEICSILSLDSDSYDPLFVVPVGE